ncbi:MAG: hypothetical protein ACTHZX_06250 [Microbacterium sp.]
MTTATASAPTTPAAARPRQDARLGFGHLVRSQWIALTSLRGTIVALVLGIGFTVAMAGAFAALIAYSAQQTGGAPMDITAMGGNTVAIAVCVAVLVGVSHYAKEHSTGALRTTLAVAPGRAALIGAKAVVIAVSTFVAALVALALSFTAVAAVYGVFGFTALDGSLLDTVALPILGGALYVTASAVLALGVAVLLRSETWSVLLVLVFLLMVPTVFLMLPYEWAPVVNDLLLSSAGGVLAEPFAGFSGDVLQALAVTVAWPTLALVAAMAVERRRDA